MEQTQQIQISENYADKTCNTEDVSHKLFLALYVQLLTHTLVKLYN